MDSEEFLELLAYDRRIEPIGEARADVRSGMIIGALLHGNASAFRSYLPEFSPPEENVQDPAVTKARLMMALGVKGK